MAKIDDELMTPDRWSSVFRGLASDLKSLADREDVMTQIATEIDLIDIVGTIMHGVDKLQLRFTDVGGSA